MRKLLTTLAVLVALIEPANADALQHEACLIGFKELAASESVTVRKVMTVDEAMAKAWRSCQHIKNKGMDSDRRIYLGDVLMKVFDSIKQGGGLP